jgi:hypothetical protein
MIHAYNTTTENMIDLWEAWVDVQENSLKPYTLHVVGEIYWQNKIVKPALVKLAESNDKVLHLDLQPGILSDTGIIREIRYSEPVIYNNKYRQVVIHVGGQILTTIDQLEEVA